MSMRASLCLVVLIGGGCGLEEWAGPVGADPSLPSDRSSTSLGSTSTGGTPVFACGDGTCDPGELCGTCPDDCGICEQGAPDIVRGPYLQSGSAEQVVIRWRTEAPTASVVAFGRDPEHLARVVRRDEPTTEHAVRLTGLRADTRYHYAVGAPEGALVGLGDPTYSWRTDPGPGYTGSTRVWVIGDSGTANGEARAVRDAYRDFTGSRGTDLWLMLGDNAYDDGTDDEYQAAVFEMYPELLRSAVLWPTIGNHDGHSANTLDQSGPYFDIFTLPKGGEAGGTPSGTEAYYSFDYANIHFVCLDSLDSSVDQDGDMLTWLRDDLLATTQPWLVAFWHHPPYSKGSHDSDSESSLEKMREEVLPVLEEHGVDLVLGGHSHAYERSMYLHGHYGRSSSLTGDMIVDGGDGRPEGDGAYERLAGTREGAVYVVAGSSGKTSSASLDHAAMYVSWLELGSVVLDVDEAALRLTFLDDAGRELDWFTIRGHGR